MKQIKQHEIEWNLRQVPCPECGEIGFLMPQHLQFRIFHNGHLIETAGDGWVCHCGCDAVFMSDEVNSELMRMAREIDVEGQGRYIETDPKTGAVSCHTLH